MLDLNFVHKVFSQPDAMSAAKWALKQPDNKITIFTGAGISAESGISTFRDPDTGALWSKFDPEVMSSMNGFMADPELVWGWYKAVKDKAMLAAPNAGHLALAKLGHPIITQNVDLLHERAGSSKVYHMHGRGDLAKCTVCDWHGAYTSLIDLPGKMPTCPTCSGLARPDVVWFGEMLDHDLLTKARELVSGSICIVVGTSGQVEPMASLIGFADLIISVNPRAEDHPTRFLKAIHLTGKGSEILPQLIA
jgi:NAD-dependent deacetylase